MAAEIEPQTTQRREIEMAEQAQTSNQTQTKDDKITKANETGILNQAIRRPHWNRRGSFNSFLKQNN
jgi:hypothetical protein